MAEQETQQEVKKVLDQSTVNDTTSKEGKQVESSSSSDSKSNDNTMREIFIENKPLEKVSKSKENLMREIFIEKIVLSCGGVKDVLDKEVKLLGKISKRKVSRRQTKKRIPGFGIRPKLEVGCMVTVRGEEAEDLLGRLLGAIDNVLDEDKIADNHFSFGIKEYIEIPGEEYDREIGMIGFKVSIVFARKGKRVTKKKIKRGTLPAKQTVTKAEIIEFMEDKFDTEFEE
jgi:large subunit ribosomal protein L5